MANVSPGPGPGPGPGTILRAIISDLLAARRREREALIDILRPGDLIDFRGNLRLVRGVSHFGPRRRPQRHMKTVGQVRSIRCVILRCSWTGRATTVINRADLYRGRLHLIRRDLPLDATDIEQRLQAEIADHGKRLTCCDVHGLR